MICTLTEDQQKKLYIAIVKQLESSKAPFDVKEYIKSIYNRIANNPKSSKELAIAYASLVPQFMYAANGLNPDTIGEILASQSREILDLNKSFKANIQNVIDYVSPPPVDIVAINTALKNQPPAGPNSPPVINNGTLQEEIDDAESFIEAIPLNFFSSTGQQSLVDEQGRFTNVEDPDKALTYKVLEKILVQKESSKTELGSELQYGQQKGIKLRIINETQLPNADANSKEENIILVITDNEGEFLNFDKDGDVSKVGVPIYYSFRMPSDSNINKANDRINQILHRREISLDKLGLTPEEIVNTIKSERKQLEKIRDQEIDKAKKVLTDYKKDINAKTLLDITGGSVGYVKPGWTDSSTIKLTDEELTNVIYSPSGFSTIKLDEVTKLIPIEGIGLYEFPVEVLDNIVKVLTASLSSGLTNQNKIDYLQSYVVTNKGQKINIIEDTNGKLYLEILGKDIDLTKPEDIKTALLNKNIHFNIDFSKIGKRYVDVTFNSEGIAKVNTNNSYSDLLQAYTRIDAKPNAEGRITELNGYFELSYTPSIEEVKKTPVEVKQIEEISWEDEELAISKLIELKTTPEQQKLAREWWANSPLSKIKHFKTGELLIPLERLTNIVNSNAFATWSIKGIKLFNGSDDTHIYHESWHGFTQLYLTKQEKNNLYNEISKKEGTFQTIVKTTSDNGDIISELKEVKFSEASKRQLEEYAAEAFRNFVISKGQLPLTKGMKGIFNKIWEFLKTLFTGVTVQDTVNNPLEIKVLNDMFNALYIGDINNYAPSVENIMFSVLNSGMISTVNINDERTHTDSDLIKSSIDGIISEMLLEKALSPKITNGANWAIRGLTVNANKIKIYKEVYARLEKRYNDLLAQKEEVGYALAPDDLLILDKNIELLKWTLNKDNFGDIEFSVNNYSQKELNNGVVAYHLENSEFNDLLKISIKEEDLSESDGSNTQRMGNKGPNEHTSLEDADNQTKYIIKSLLEQDASGNFVKNDLGFPKLVNFTLTWNNLRRRLTGEVQLGKLYNNIISNKEALYQQLATRLGNPDNANNEQAGLWVKFLKDFNKPIQQLITHIAEIEYDKGKAILKQKTGRAYADVNKVKLNWQTRFRLDTPDTNDYIIPTAENTNYLDLPKIVKEFLVYNDKTDSYDLVGTNIQKLKFLNAIGFFIEPTEKNANDIDNKLWITIGFIGKYISQLNNADVKIFNPIEFFSKKSDGKTITYDKGDLEKKFPIIKNVKIDSQSGNISALVRIEAANSDMYSSSSKLNAAGESQSEEALNSTVSKHIYALKNVKNLLDFSNENGDYYYMSYLSRQNNPMAKASVFMKSLFNNKDVRTNTSIDVLNLSGTAYKDNTKEEGVSHAGMSIMDKFITDFTMLLTSGTIGHQIAGSKSTFYATKLSNIDTYQGKKQKDLFIDSFQFITNKEGNYSGSDKMFDIVVPYIQAELERIIMYNEGKKEYYSKYKNFSDKTTGDFAIFDDILEEDTKTELKNTVITDILKEGIKKGDDTSLLDILNSNPKLKNKVQGELKYYFDGLYNDYQKNLMDKYGFISDQIREEIVRTMGGDIALLKNDPAFQTQIDNAALKSFVHNHWLNNIETSFLHNGEVTAFNHSKDEFHKRISLFQSSGDVFPTDLTARNMVNRLWKSLLTKKVTGKDVLYTGRMNTGIIKDLMGKIDDEYKELHELFKVDLIKKGLKGKALNIALYGEGGNYNEPTGGKMQKYFKPEITDGQGYITLDTYRILKNSEGKWSDEQDKLYMKIVNGDTISIEDAKQMFPVYKLQYAGNLKTKQGTLPVTSAHKFALFPLVTNPSNKETPLEELHYEMMMQDMDYITHTSGSKLASITSNDKKEADTVFDEETGHFIPGTQFTKNEIFVDYLKNQVDLNTELKGHSILSTQLRVMLPAGLMNEGVAVDYLPTASDKTRKLGWDKLSEVEKMETSEYYKLQRTYENRVTRLVELKKEDLISKIKGWSKNPKTGRYNGPINTLIDFVKKELKLQDLTDHELNYIDVDNEGKLVRDLSGSPIADKIEKMLLSIINNKVIKQEITGEPLVEVSSANTAKFRKPTKGEITKYGDKDLRWYKADPTGKKNTISCQIKLSIANGSYANLFNLNDLEGKKIAKYIVKTDENGKVTKTLDLDASLDILNSLLRNEDWLNRDNNRKKITLTGVRIPVQGLNSMEFAEIVEFLHPTAGNIIILPAKIVAKSGTDFDVDKLTTYMASISKQGNWLSDTYNTREDINKEIEKTQEKLKSLLKIKNLEGDDIKSLLKDYNSIKKDKGLSILALKLKRDLLNSEIANNLDEIRDFIRAKNVDGSIFGLLKDLVKANDQKALSIITKFTNKPTLLSKGAISKVYDAIKEKSKVLSEIKETLGDAYEDKDNYLKENPEINDLVNKLAELKDQQRNFIAYVQNSLINDITNILELPINAIRLLTANDTHLAEPLAIEMEEFVQEQNFKSSRRKNGKAVSKGISPTRIFEYDFNLTKHQNNFVGKDSLGISAIGNKGNIVYNNAGAYIPTSLTYTTTEVRVNDKGDYEKIDVKEEVPTIIYLPVRKSNFVENGKLIQAISLSNIYDSLDDNEISEIISQLMNGFVDVEKNAWVAFIQGNKEVTPVILFLLEAGVPIKDIVYYVSNPLIRSYISEIKSHKGVLGSLKGYNSEQAKSDAKYTVWKSLGNKGAFPTQLAIQARLKKEYDETIFSTKKLESIAKTSLKDTIKSKDTDAVNGFLHYLYIEELTRNFSEIRTATNFDTKKSTTLFDVFNRQLIVDQLYESTKMPRKLIEYILEQGPISAFRTTEFSQDLFGKLFPFRNGEVVNTYLSDVLKDYGLRTTIKKITGMNHEIFPTRFKNALMLYLFVNNLKSFSIGDSKFYKGMPVNYVTTGTKPIETKLSTSTEGPPQLIININENLLKREFKNQKYTLDAEGPDSYSEQGLATVTPEMFYKANDNATTKAIGEREYYDFVIEREYLRIIKPFEKFSKTHKFKSTYKKLVSGKGVYNQKKDESDIDFKKRVAYGIYEDFLKNQALENSFNLNTIYFDHQTNGVTAYAKKLFSIIKKYPNLEKKFSILKQLSISYYSTQNNKSTDTNYLNNLINISLKDASDLTADSTKQYHDDLIELSDPSKNKINIDTDEAREDNERLSDLFRKFPIYVFLQGGMNKNEFAFNSILPYSDKSSAYSTIMNDAIGKTKNLFNWIEYIEDSELPKHAVVKKSDALGRFYADARLLKKLLNMFINNNKSADRKLNQRTAGKNYMNDFVMSDLMDGLRKESLVPLKTEWDDKESIRITSTSIPGVNTIDLTDAKEETITKLATRYQGKAYFITDDNTFAGANIKIRIGALDTKKVKITPENIVALKGGIDKDIKRMIDALGQGVALVFNEKGYGQNILDIPVGATQTIANLHRELYAYLNNQLFEKIGIENAPSTLTVESVIVPTSTESSVIPEVKLMIPPPKIGVPKPIENKTINYPKIFKFFNTLGGKNLEKLLSEKYPDIELVNLTPYTKDIEDIDEYETTGGHINFKYMMNAIGTMQKLNAPKDFLLFYDDKNDIHYTLYEFVKLIVGDVNDINPKILNPNIKDLFDNNETDEQTCTTNPF